MMVGGEGQIGRAMRGGALQRDEEELKREDADTAALVARIQGGAEAEFATLYERYFDRVYGYLRVMLRDRHEAEDVAQQVFIQVLQGLPKYERRSQPFRAWLFAIARNRALMVLRKSKRLDVVDPDDIEVDEASAGLDQPAISPLQWISDQDLMLFVERLPLAQRQVLVMRFMLGMTGPEIASVLDRTQVDVRTLQHRALRFLEQRLTALGRSPSSRRGRSRMRRCLRPANVLRGRRYALVH